MKKIASFVLGALALAAAWSSPAAAQSPCPYIAPGAVLTSAQWQSCFSGKQDALGFTPISPANIVGIAPVTATPVGSIVNVGLNFNSSFTISGGNLALNPATTNIFSIWQIIDRGSGASEPGVGSGAGWMLYGSDGSPIRDEITAFNNGVSGAAAIFDGRTSLGTRSSPTAVTAGTMLTSFEGKGFDSSVWTGTGASLHIYAEGTFTPTSHPGEACLAATISGATATTDGLCLHQSGGVSIGANVDPGYIGLNVANPALAQSQFALDVTATLPVVATGANEGVLFNITSAGNSTQAQRALFILFNAGYVGTKAAAGIDVQNTVNGTGTLIIPAPESTSTAENIGTGGAVINSTTGYNVAITGHSQGGAVNVGVHGYTPVSQNNGLNIGVIGTAYNHGTGTVGEIGGYFNLDNQVLPFGVSAALVADNSTEAQPIALFRVNGVTKVTIDQNGTLSTIAAPLASPTSGQASFGGSSTFGAVITGNGSAADVDLRNSAGSDVCNVAHAATVLNCVSLALTNPLAVPSGGSGAATLTANAFLTGNGTSPINQVAITGLVLGNGASPPTAYAGTSCTSQSVTALSAAGVATCGSPPAGPVAVGDSLTGGTPNGLLFNSANTIGNLATANNGVLVTSSGGVPSISTTLPSGIAATNMVLTTPSLGVAAGTSLALGGATIGGNALAVTGTTLYSGAVSVSGAPFGLTGNQSLAAWTTGGARYANVPGTLTDTTSSGTVAAVYDSAFGGNTIAASSATTYTLAVGSYFKAPVAGTNATFTANYALGADSFDIVGGTLAAGANVLNISATQLASPSATQTAVQITITGNGSAAQQNNGIVVTYAAGYTGASLTSALVASNANLGTGGTLSVGGGANGNFGGNYAANGATAGNNYGVQGRAVNAAKNIGVLGLSNLTVNSATSIGVAGMGINTGTSAVEIGGWFTLGQTTFPAVSAALIADNAGQSTAPIAIFQSGGSQVASIGPTGHILASGTAPTISACGTGSPTISGGDNFGKVVAGTVATSCVINFGTTWGTAPSCMASSSTAIASLTVSATTTQLTIAGTALGGDTITWICGSTAELEPEDLPGSNDNWPPWLSKAG